MSVVGKVTGFVTRGTGDRAELLVFEHPRAGLQVPAGTVEPNEEPADAVLREVREETGVVARVERVLMERTVGLPPDARMLAGDVQVFSEPDLSATRAWRGLPRGLLVTYLDEQDGFARVRHRSMDLVAEELLWEVDGWVPTDALASAYTRTLFHCTTDEETPDVWEVPHAGSDDDQTFRCSWVPLRDPPQLVIGQDAWLAAVVEELRAGTARAQR